jgi:hypothetical protein
LKLDGKIIFRQFEGCNCRISKSLASKCILSKGTFRIFKQIANQDGLGIHSDSNFSRNTRKVHAKTEITLQFGLGEYAAPRQHAGSRAFQVGKMAFHSEVQRGATFVDTNWENLDRKAFKPLPGKGLC